jgi:hypothetical protein
VPRDRDGNQGLIEPSPFYPRGLLTSNVVAACANAVPSALGHLGAMGTRLRQAGTAAVHVRRDKAALFQWVQAPPGDRSSRKRPEQTEETKCLKPSDSGHDIR